MSRQRIASPDRDTPGRVIHHADALAWLAAHRPLAGSSIITSLPDAAEMPGLGFDDWRAWFDKAVQIVAETVPDEGVAIFFQSDVRRSGAWVDKGYLVTCAALRAGLQLLFHRIVCRVPPGTRTVGRSSYSHLLGFARRVIPPTGEPIADVLADAGFMPGTKAMGSTACAAACRFVLDHTATRTIVDPFCGFGTVLAVANALGMNAIGVDTSARMCRRAQNLKLPDDALPGTAAASRVP